MSSNNEYNQMCGFKAAAPGPDRGQCKQDSVLFLRSLYGGFMAWRVEAASVFLQSSDWLSFFKVTPFFNLAVTPLLSWLVRTCLGE